jgi:hypothetical protein
MRKLLAADEGGDFKPLGRTVADTVESILAYCDSDHRMNTIL